MEDNINTALHHAARRLADVTDIPALEARLLLQKILHCTHADLIIHANQPLTSEQEVAFNALVSRRLTHEPIAYIIEEKDFWSRTFHTPSGVLIPRPDSELFLEKTHALFSDKSAPLKIAELGVGSGALIVSLLADFPNATAEGTDLSEKALQVTAENARRHGVESRLTRHHGSWAEPLTRPCNLILSNPPYISEEEMQALMPDVRLHEPHTALCGGAQGTEPYRVLIPSALKKLKSGGLLMLEIGHTQCKDVTLVLQENGLQQVECVKDMAGLDRLLIGWKA